MIVLGIASLGALMGWLLYRSEKKQMARERTALQAEIDAYAEALNRTPYPPDVSAILSEWLPSSDAPAKRT